MLFRSDTTMIRIGIEFDKQTVDGRTYRRVAPFIHGVNRSRIAARIGAGIAIAAFIWVATMIAPDVQTRPMVDVSALHVGGR